MQQNTDCTLILTNVGNQPDDALHPNTNPWTLAFRVTEVKTGIETLYQPKRSPFDEERKIAFKGGEADQVAVPLLMKVSLPSPVEYEISAIWMWGTAKPAESNAVRVKILPFTPRNLTLFRSEYPAFSASVLNVAVDPPIILRARLRLQPGGGVERLDPIAPGTLKTAAVLSEGPNQTIVSGDWAAWLDGRRLVAAHIDALGSTSPARSAELPEGDWQIVTPLSTEPPPEDGSRPAGSALLLRTLDRKASVLVCSLNEAAVRPGPVAHLPGIPLWTRALTLSDGRQLLLFCTQESQKLRLHCCPWPATQAKPPEVVTLAEWPDAEFAGAGAMLDADDNLQGGLLVWKKAKPPTLEFVNWQATPKGNYRELTVRQIGYDYDHGVSRSIVRVFQSGFFAALIRGNDGHYVLWDPIHGQSVLVGPMERTPLPLDLSKIKSDEPVLLSGAVATGIRFLRPDGSPLKFAPK